MLVLRIYEVSFSVQNQPKLKLWHAMLYRNNAE